jgi:hypothetical protein
MENIWHFLLVKKRTKRRAGDIEIHFSLQAGIASSRRRNGEHCAEERRRKTGDISPRQPFTSAPATRRHSSVQQGRQRPSPPPTLHSQEASLERALHKHYCYHYRASSPCSFWPCEVSVPSSSIARVCQQPNNPPSSHSIQPQAACSLRSHY